MPALLSWTTTVGAMTWAQATGVLVASGTNGAFSPNLQAKMVAAGATFDVKVHIAGMFGTDASGNQSYYAAGLAVGDGTTFRTLYNIMSGNGDVPNLIVVDHWATSTNQDSRTLTGTQGEAFPWLRITNAAGTFTFYVSSDGVNWLSLGTAASAGFNLIGVCFSPGTTSQVQFDSFG